MKATHTGDTLKALGPGELGTLHCRALQDLSFIRPLLSREDNVADFPNTWKQIQRGRQNKETEECVPNERTEQNYNRRSKQNRNK